MRGTAHHRNHLLERKQVRAVRSWLDTQHVPTELITLSFGNRSILFEAGNSAPETRLYMRTDKQGVTRLTRDVEASEGRHSCSRQAQTLCHMLNANSDEQGLLWPGVRRSEQTLVKTTQIHVHCDPRNVPSTSDSSHSIPLRQVAT